MRPVRQLRVITTKLEVLEDMKVHLEKLLAFISDVILKGTTWIEETNNEPFDVVDQFLTDETKECFQKCVEIASGNNKFPLQSDQHIEAIIPSSTEDAKDYQKLKEKIDKLEKRYTSQKSRINSVCQQLNDLEKETKSAYSLKDVTMKEAELKFEVVMNELQAASNFMSQLQTQNETLAKQVKENEKQYKDLELKLNILEEHSSTHSKEVNSFDSLGLNDLNEKLSKNKKSIDQAIEMTESLKTKIQDIESKFNSMPNNADSVSESIQALSLNLTTSKLSIENTLKNYTEKTEALEKKVTVYDGKIADFANQLIDASKRIISLESPDVPVAFDACVSWEKPMNLKKDKIMTCFRNVIHDLQNNYNPHTGIFTVPVTGLYLCSLGIDVASYIPHDLAFCLYVKKPFNKEDVIATCHSKLRGNIVCDVVVRELDINDTVYVKPLQGCKNIELDHYSHFFCALFKKI